MRHLTDEQREDEAKNLLKAIEEKVRELEEKVREENQIKKANKVLTPTPKK